MTVLYSLAVTVLLLPTVHAAVCTEKTQNACTKSLYTDQSCNAVSKICDCISDYFPIPSGCARKPMKPTVVLEAGRITYIASGKSANLTCNTSETITSDVSFDWMLEDTVSSLHTQNYTITNATDTTVGNFRCKVRLTGGGVSLESDYSDPKPIQILTPTTPFTLAVMNIPATAAEGGRLNPMCTGIPLGLTYKFMLGNNPSQLVPAPIVFSASQSNITCVLDETTWYSNSSSTFPMPMVATGIQGVQLLYVGVSQDLTFKTGTVVTLVCYVPESMYPVNNIKYTFSDSKNASASAIGNMYMMQTSVAEQHVVTCTASYMNGMNGNTSSSLTVTFSDTYITTPVLSANENPVTEGSGLVLTCTYTPASMDQVVYTWTKNNQSIFYQEDNIIQFGSVSGREAARYRCSVRKNNYVVTSDVLTIEVKAHAVVTLSSALLVLGAAMLSLLV